MKKVIINDEINKNSCYQTPKTKIIVNEILSEPTIFINTKSPYCLNSKTILSYLNIQTIIFEIEIVSCYNIKYFT